jgi:hypothetical protein
MRKPPHPVVALVTDEVYFAARDSIAKDLSHAG